MNVSLNVQVYFLTYFFFLHSFESITIPHREDPRHAHLSKRWDSVRPLGMFKSTDQEFLLCYDGMYIIITYVFF